MLVLGGQISLFNDDLGSFLCTDNFSALPQFNVLFIL
jgi:hypothetical protein